MESRKDLLYNKTRSRRMFGGKLERIREREKVRPGNGVIDLSLNTKESSKHLHSCLSIRNKITLIESTLMRFLDQGAILLI